MRLGRNHGGGGVVEVESWHGAERSGGVIEAGGAWRWSHGWHGAEWWSYGMESSHGVIAWSHRMESSHGVITWSHGMGEVRWSE